MRNASVITVSSYTNKQISGILFNAENQLSVRFDNLVQLLLLMNALLEKTDFPQSWAKRRTFGDKPEFNELLAHGPIMVDSPLATFHVTVLFRQNATWQGILVWKDQKQETPFRSVLELIELMDSALSQPSQKAYGS